jgi:DNA transformation protein
VKPPDPFVERILALLMPVGPARARRMFGGHGIFMDDVMFALVARGKLYLKVDPSSEPEFKSAGAAPFTYRRQGRETAMSYWSVPDGALDDMAALAPWADLALAAARRAKAK